MSMPAIDRFVRENSFPAKLIAPTSWFPHRSKLRIVGAAMESRPLNPTRIIVLGTGFGGLAWLFIHLLLLVGLRNRLAVFINWIYSYVNYKRGARIITRLERK